MSTEKYEIRKSTVPELNAIIVYKETETVLYVKPYNLEASKLVDLVNVIDKFLNRK